MMPWMICHGYGQEDNEEQALLWFSLASMRGHCSAYQRLQTLSPLFTPEQLRKAKQEAVSLLPPQ